MRLDGMMEVDEEEIREQLRLALDRPDQYSDLSYTQGVKMFALYILGESDEKPMD